MGRPRKLKCNWNDCFTCPYDDCIDTNKFDGVGIHYKKKGPGRPKIYTDEEVHQHQLAYARKHYQEVKEKRAEYYKEYYQKNMKRIKAQQKEYRERRKANG